MRIIKQNPSSIPVRLPDFRNLGVVLRIVLIVSLMSVVAAVLRSDSPNAAWRAILEISAIVQPVTLVTLFCLVALNRWLLKLAYFKG